MKVAALASSGLDSCVMLRDLAAEGATVLPVYLRTRLLWEDAEIHWLERFQTAARIGRCERLTVLELPVDDLYGEHWNMTDHGVPGVETTLDSNYLPGRNLLLSGNGPASVHTGTSIAAIVRSVANVTLHGMIRPAVAVQ